MAVNRQQNWLSGIRVDTQDLRSIESGVTNDFDVLAGRMLAGQVPLILKGFTISTAGTLGNRSDLLQLAVGGGLLMHFGAAEAGTIFYVPDATAAEVLSATNSKVSGSFTAGTTNYVGLDLRRSADTTTSDAAKFLDASTKQEIGKTVPKARILNYQIIISTQPFSVTTNVAPVAKIVTDGSNNIVSITDARRMMFRLGAGSDLPNATSSFTWGTRQENLITFSGSSAADPFSNGDKSIGSLKQWMDAVMTRLWEVGSGRYWYSPTSRDGTKLLFGQPVVVASGDNFFWTLGSQTLQWDGLQIAFENSFADDGSGVYKNTITTGSAVIGDGQCLYVDLQRTTQAASLVPAVTSLTSLWAANSPAIPGSRFIIAWRIGNYIYVRDRGFEVGRPSPVATTTTLGVVQLNATPLSVGNPSVVSIGAGGGAICAASSGNTNGFLGTASSASGTSSGVRGNGDPTAVGLGFQSNGVAGVATGTGRGGTFIGGDMDGTGVAGRGGGTNGIGGDFTGFGTGAGVKATASGLGPGVKSIGGVNSSDSSGPVPATFTPGPGTGGAFVGATGSLGGDGVQGFAQGSGQSRTGVWGAGNSTAVTGIAGGPGGLFLGGTPTVGNANGGNGASGQGGAKIGSGTDGYGLTGNGGGSNGSGVLGTGVGAGAGVTGTGDVAGSGPGGTFSGTGTNATGVIGSSTGGAAAFHAISVKAVKAAGGSPASTTAFTNELTAANMTKAWCHATWTGGGAPVVVAGFNITSVTKSGANKLIITFATSFSGSGPWNFALVGTMFSPGATGYIVMEDISSRSATTAGIQVWNTASAAAFDFTTTGGEISIVVYGNQ